MATGNRPPKARRERRSGKGQHQCGFPADPAVPNRPDVRGGTPHVLESASRGRRRRRSEERRVGKECRSRWAGGEHKKDETNNRDVVATQVKARDKQQSTE